ncbi:glycosyltransferase family 9 protein [Oleispirillum naphthae]|uniref:glycosyltransferase family 9 protein n=1 Tax=Oleispirillum naphthae TaxID=2838853 RepID=UPI003082557E
MTDAEITRAVAACRAALGRDPAEAERLALAHLDGLGENPELRAVAATARLARGDARGALADFRLAAKWGGGGADFYYAMGVACREAGRAAEATSCWRRALTLMPGHADAAVNATLAALQAAAWEEARRVAADALAAGVADPRLPLWLGHALAKLHREAEAAVAYREAVGRAPGDPEAWFALALALRDTCAFAAARAALARVLELAPEHADAAYEAAQLDLMAGRWREGFSRFDARLRRRLPLLPAEMPGEPWDGAPRPGATLLLQAEQGFGDTLQFLRFGFAAAQRVGRVVLRAHPPLLPLFADAALPWRTVPLDAPVAADFHVPLLSLPRVLGLDAIADTPAAYLPAEAQAAPNRVGVVWAGSAAHYNDTKRSCPLAEFAALRQVAGIEFVHFQFGADAAAVRRLWPDLADGTQGAADFRETARRLAACALVVCVDTAAAHLAGALGRPAWVLVPAAPDWRWGAAGEATPWYPRARVWRQAQPGGWAELLERVAAGLAAWRDNAAMES